MMLCFAMCFGTLTNIKAIEESKAAITNVITDQIVEECLASGDYELNNDGKLTLTLEGKEKAEKLNLDILLDNTEDQENNNGDSRKYVSIDPDYGSNITYKNETKVVCSGITEYVYMSHSKAKSHISEITQYKNSFGHVKITNSNAYNLLIYVIGFKITGYISTFLTGIIVLFSYITDFLTYYLNKITLAYNNAHASEGIIVTWWRSTKVISAKTQGY